MLPSPQLLVILAEAPKLEWYQPSHQDLGPNNTPLKNPLTLTPKHATLCHRNTHHRQLERQ